MKTGSKIAIGLVGFACASAIIENYDDRTDLERETYAFALAEETGQAFDHTEKGLSDAEAAFNLGRFTTETVKYKKSLNSKVDSKQRFRDEISSNVQAMLDEAGWNPNNGHEQAIGTCAVAAANKLPISAEDGANYFFDRGDFEDATQACMNLIVDAAGNGRTQFEIPVAIYDPHAE